MIVEPIRDFDKFVQIQKLLIDDGKVRECLLFQLMYNTNLRVSDALLIHWRDVITKDAGIVDTLIITEKKTSKSKWTPVTEQLDRSLINFYYKYRPNIADYIFRSESNRVRGRNQPWNRNYVYSFIKFYAKKANIKDNVGSHSPRKTWGYHAYQNGIDIYEIMRILNHSDIRTTEIYCGLDADKIRDNYSEVSKLNKAADSLLLIDNLPDRSPYFNRLKKKRKRRK